MCAEGDSPVLFPDHLPMVPDRKIGAVPSSIALAAYNGL
jgi:hypothetical protein